MDIRYRSNERSDCRTNPNQVRRALLALNSLDAKLAQTPELTQLYTCYYNLVRMWVEP